MKKEFIIGLYERFIKPKYLEINKKGRRKKKVIMHFAYSLNNSTSNND